MSCGGAVRAPFHVGIATPDIDASMAVLGGTLDLRWVPLDRPDFLHDTPTGQTRPAGRVVYSAEGPLHTELLQSGDGTVYPLDRGVHLHHVGYWVDDFDRAMADAARSGWTWEVTILDDDGRPSTFAYLSRPGHTWIELIDVANRDALMDLLAGGHP